MSRSPITVQHWVDSLQRSATTSQQQHNNNNKKKKFLARDLSLQSDDASSLCSSVESVLELRKADPEEVLLGLGFGPPRSASVASRIPQRFLQPSKLLSHIDISKFLEQQGEVQVSAEKQFPSAPASPLHVRPKTH